MYQNRKLEEIIDLHGKTSISTILKHVKNIQDLCIFNKAFITNRLYRNINYLAEFGKAEDTNGHDIERNKLTHLHDYGIITSSGQSNLLLPNEHQRGYLEFYTSKITIDRLKDSLLQHPDIYTIIFYNKTQHISNFPKDTTMINLTKRKDKHGEWTYPTNYWNDFSHSIYTYKDEYEDDTRLYFPKVNKIVDECALVCIICIQYGHTINCSDILLDLLQSCGIQRILYGTEE